MASIRMLASIVAQWKAEHLANNTKSDENVSSPVIEEIEMIGCYGTDTAVLEADVMRAAREMAEKKN